MWRTFWRDIDNYPQSLDAFLNLIEADGFQPHFIQQAAAFANINGMRRVYVTARKKE